MVRESLRVRCPAGHDAARLWIFEQIFVQQWGLDFSVEVDASLTSVVIDLANGACVEVRETFFAQPEEQWLQASTLPQLPLPQADFRMDSSASALVEPSLPVLFGAPCVSGAWVERQVNRAVLGIDVFGGAFVLLTRYEEAVDPSRDQYERFPAEASIAVRENFIERPLADEYSELLWSLVSAYAGTSLRRQGSRFKVSLGHDVDAPYKYLFCGPMSFAKTELASRLRRHERSSLWDNVRTWRRVRAGDLRSDPYNTFDLLMDASELRGWRSTFYFIADRTAGWKDGLYDIDDSAIILLMTRMRQRGHWIALHGSFNSYDSADHLAREKRRIEEAVCKAGFPVPIDEIRQHYLRFDVRSTPAAWSDAGLRLDTTLSFAQRAGFRCGTSRRYRMFDLVRRSPLSVFEQPLIVMDTSLLEYQKFDAISTVECVRRLAMRVARYGGCFTLLWHNSTLVNNLQRQLYHDVLDTLSHVEASTVQ